MAEGGGLQSNSGARHRILYPELPCPRHSVATGNHRGNNKALEKAISPPPTGRSRNNWSKAMMQLFIDSFVAFLSFALAKNVVLSPRFFSSLLSLSGSDGRQY